MDIYARVRPQVGKQLTEAESPRDEEMHEALVRVIFNQLEERPRAVQTANVQTRCQHQDDASTEGNKRTRRKEKKRTEEAHMQHDEDRQEKKRGPERNGNRHSRDEKKVRSSLEEREERRQGERKKESTKSSPECRGRLRSARSVPRLRITSYRDVDTDAEIYTGTQTRKQRERGRDINKGACDACTPTCKESTGQV